MRAGKSSEAGAETGEPSTGTTTGTDASSAAAKSPGTITKDDTGKKKEEMVKVITPELRQLLSRTVEVLPRKDVVGKGDGFQPK